MPCDARRPPFRIDLTVSTSALWRFFALLRKGFYLDTPLPCSLETLLCERLEIPRDYVLQRIQTVFLDGRAVDELSAVRVADGAAVALSAAMPGLVGATLRRGGKLTPMRSSISHHLEDSDGLETAMGRVTVKLFNLVCDELGPALLARGVGLTPGDVEDFVADRWAQIAPACRSARVDDAPLGPESLPAALAPGRPVRLRVGTAD